MENGNNKQRGECGGWLPLALVATINGQAPDLLTLKYQGREGARIARLVRGAGC